MSPGSTATTKPDKAVQAAIAAHRFGLGEASLAGVGSDPQGWLLAQLGPAGPQRGTNLASGVEGLKRYAQFIQQRQRARQRLAAGADGDMAMAGVVAGGADMASSATPAGSTELAFVENFRSIVQADVRARLATAATSEKPFNERIALFWANHFTVSMAKASARGIVGAFEREAIRPHTAGSFATLLKASTTHAGMLRYLDNEQSAGPNSRVVQRRARAPQGSDSRPPRVSGLNENLAREVLELHTLGAAGGGSAHGGWGGYTQSDVTELARVLTGWRVPLRELVQGGASDGPASRFDPAWHDPGPKTVLGQRYSEGEAALDRVLQDLAAHPATARHICFKLARHFVADTPPPALVAQLVAAWQASQGHLPAVYKALVQSPDAWHRTAAKLKTPEEFVVSTVRVLGLGERAFERQADGGIAQLGQRVQAAPSPAGWPEQAAEWLGPDALWKRIEWATRVADRVGRQTDARALASASFGPLLSAHTAQQVERAADGPQALALLLLAPEFQRR